MGIFDKIFGGEKAVSTNMEGLGVHSLSDMKVVEKERSTQEIMDEAKMHGIDLMASPTKMSTTLNSEQLATAANLKLEYDKAIERGDTEELHQEKMTG